MSNSFREKLLTLNIGKRTKDTVREWKSADGERHKAVTDELNNTVTQHAKGDRQDVLIRAPQVKIETVTKEVR